jgi:hypothetical protein
MERLAVICADVGSIKAKKFGWAASLPDGGEILGTEITSFAEVIAKQIQQRNKVALGFECPLFVPIRENPVEVNGARAGEGNRPWSAGAGTGALATGIVEVLWVMNEVTRYLGKSPEGTVEWNEFLQTDSVFLWEAFVTSSAKGSAHEEDAKIAVKQFEHSLPNPWLHNAVEETSVLSLVGAAALRSGWSNSQSILEKPCLVIKA